MNAELFWKTYLFILFVQTDSGDRIFFSTSGYFAEFFIDFVTSFEPYGRDSEPEAMRLSARNGIGTKLAHVP